MTTRGTRASKSYRTAKSLARPAWLTLKERQICNAIYKASRKITEMTGVKYSVDHIYPLRGENVCGLHVPSNLRIMPSVANSEKGNL